MKLQGKGGRAVPEVLLNYCFESNPDLSLLPETRACRTMEMASRGERCCGRAGRASYTNTLAPVTFPLRNPYRCFLTLRNHYSPIITLALRG